jgi:phosphoribosylaminoimidazole carboxylase PurE protein
MDSLFSTLQMPSGVPVACVGLGNSGARNAAVLAVQILAAADPEMREALRSYKANQADGVAEQNANIQEWLRDRI